MLAELFNNLFSKKSEQEKDLLSSNEEPLLGGFLGGIATGLVTITSLLPGGQIISPKDNDEINNPAFSQTSSSHEEGLPTQKPIIGIRTTEKSASDIKNNSDINIENIVADSPDIKETLATVIAGLREVSHTGSENTGNSVNPTAIAATNTAREARSGGG